MTQDNLATRDNESNFEFFRGVKFSGTENKIDYDANIDTGKHYRYMYKGVKLDPFRIAAIYKVTDFAMQQILKKCLCSGKRGHKSRRQDLLDIITSANRAIEMLDEDEQQAH